MTKLTPKEVKGITFTPNEAVKLALENVESRRTEHGMGLPMFIPCVDRYLLPGRPGELISIIGKTSNYKSGLMSYWARQASAQILDRRWMGRCVVYVTWEQAIEEVVGFDLASTAQISATDIYAGRIDDSVMDRLRTVGPKRSARPLFLVGHSLQEGRARPRLTLTAVAQALLYIRREYGFDPYVIYLDYLQQIESEEGENRRMQVFENVTRCKDMALAMRCPVVLATQAKTESYSRQWGMPRVSDSMESSNLWHTTDKMVGVWLPCKDYRARYTASDGMVYAGQEIKVQGTNDVIEVTEHLLYLKVLKQRFGPSGRQWPLWVDLERNDIKGEYTKDGQ